MRDRDAAVGFFPLVGSPPLFSCAPRAPECVTAIPSAQQWEGLLLLPKRGGGVGEEDMGVPPEERGGGLKVRGDLMFLDALSLMSAPRVYSY